MSEHGLDYSRIAVAAVLLIALTTRASAQTSLSRPRDDQRAVLADYEGEYSYHAAANLLIVASDTMLFAVLDEAKYPLRSLGADRFLNASGDTIPFRRGADGIVSGFLERGVYFPRRTRVVDSSMAADVRATARPLVRSHGKWVELDRSSPMGNQPRTCTQRLPTCAMDSRSPMPPPRE